MKPEPFLVSLRDLEIALPTEEAGAGKRVRISVRAIVAGFTGEPDDRFDTDEIADLVRGCATRDFATLELMARVLRDEVLQIRGVVSAMTSIKDVDTHGDADFVAISTIPEPKHAVLYGILP